MPLTVPSAFAASVKQHANRAAVIAEDRSSLSYTELDAMRWQAARALLARGVKAGDRVAIWAPNRVEWIIAGLAIHTLGAVLVPVNTRMRGAEAAHVLNRSRAKLLFCVGRFLGQHYPEMLGAHKPPTLEHIVVLGESAHGDFAWEEFLQGADSIELKTAREHADDVRPDSLMDILFTSGTTGLPKGVMTEHAQNLRVIAEWSRHVGLSADDRYLVVNPFFHAFGYKVGWLGGLLAGATVLPHAVFDASVVMQRIAEQRISVLPAAPTLFISLLNDPARAQFDLSSLRATITGAATIPPSLIERMRLELGFRVVLTGYGLTETCGVVSLCKEGDDAETVALTSGRPIPETEVRCVDPQGRLVAAGEAGEIVVRGYNVMRGYLDDEGATREAIDAEGWLHTGDIGCMDARGHLRITDRLKDMYICGGFKAYPAEIERAMAAHPAIAQVAVIGVPDERLGEVGKACVVLRPQAQLAAEELMAWCRERIANYKLPRSVEFMAALPTNPSGKVLKYELRRQV